MKVGKVLMIVFGALIVIGVAGALFAAGQAPPPSTPTRTLVFSPKPAPYFKLTLFSGQTVTLKDLTGKGPVIINFWASWCPPCRDEAPTLSKVSKEYEGRVRFIGIVTNDSQSNAEAFMKEFGITYDNGIDQENIGVKYGITGIPETFWINNKGQIIDHWIGAIDEASLASRNQKLLQ